MNGSDGTAKKSIKDYQCLVGPDESGNVVQVVVFEEYANSCVNCICQKLFADCLIGPDSAGKLVEIKYTYIAADECDHSSCVSSTHDGYEEIWRQRVAESSIKVEQKEDVISSGQTAS